MNSSVSDVVAEYFNLTSDHAKVITADFAKAIAP
jgi:hypothetical protein